MEFKHLVVGQDVGLQLRRPAQGVAVNFKQLVRWHAVCGWIKVAHIGEQKLQRVAHPPVGVHHPRQNLVVDVQVARVIGGGHPQAHDLRAHLCRHSLWVNRVAQALAHLAALAIGGKPVG